MTESSTDATHRRFALIGAGFWARFQLAGWGEVPGAECIAICNRTVSKAERLAVEFDIAEVYDDVALMLKQEQPDFVDIVTDVGTHSELTHLAASHGVAVICQKPLARSVEEAQAMLAACRAAGVPLLVHENWRWQRPIRQVKQVLDEGQIGTPFRARIDMISGYSVFENQPALRELEQFLLTDLGSHILDVARFLFGEAQSVHCRTASIHKNIRGEDVATVMMDMNGGRTTVTCNMAYAGNALERECFPQTLIFVEGDRGSLELAPDYWVRTTVPEGTNSLHVPPHMYPWLDPEYAVVHSSIVDCHRDLFRSFIDPCHKSETMGEDNLRTLNLVYDAYESSKQR